MAKVGYLLVDSRDTPAMYPTLCYPVNGQLETPIGGICRVFRAFCDVIDLLGTSQDKAKSG